MKITAKQRQEARNNDGQKYISLNVDGYDFEIGYGLDLQNPDVLRKYYSLRHNKKLILVWTTWSKLEKKITEIINN
mgnify:CR=1 FL=1